jgi:hypothetical protein
MQTYEEILTSIPQMGGLGGEAPARPVEVPRAGYSHGGDSGTIVESWSGASSGTARCKYLMYKISSSVMPAWP